MKREQESEGKRKVDEEYAAGIRKIAKSKTAAENERPASYQQRSNPYGLEDLDHLACVGERALKLVDLLVEQHRDPHRDREIQYAGVGHKFRRPRPRSCGKDRGPFAQL